MRSVFLNHCKVLWVHAAPSCCQVKGRGSCVHSTCACLCVFVSVCVSESCASLLRDREKLGTSG
jgi:hypothetical protein